MSVIEYFSYPDGEDGGEGRHHLVCEVCDGSAPEVAGVRGIVHHELCCVPAMIRALDMLSVVIASPSCRGCANRRLSGYQDEPGAREVAAELRRALTPVSAMGDAHPGLVDVGPTRRSR